MTDRLTIAIERAPAACSEVNPKRWRLNGRSKVGFHVSGSQLTHMGCLEL